MQFLIPEPDYRFGYAGVVIFYLAPAAVPFRYVPALSARAGKMSSGRDDLGRHQSTEFCGLLRSPLSRQKNRPFGRLVRLFVQGW
ncbi:MAG: hypothetical protein R3D02_07450 [Hyphomicrobiales bacterium]